MTLNCESFVPLWSNTVPNADSIVQMHFWSEKQWYCSKLFLLRTDFQGSCITPWVVKLSYEALWKEIEVRDVGRTYWGLEEKIREILKHPFSLWKLGISTNSMRFWTTFLSFEQYLREEGSGGIIPPSQLRFPPSDRFPSPPVEFLEICQIWFKAIIAIR